MGLMPTAEQFSAFTEWDHEGPVVMINLLQFAERATGEGAGEGAGDPTSGRDSYRTYGETAVKMVEERGGKVVWSGRPGPLLIGDAAHDQWDMVILVEYPSRQAFLDMVSQPAYREAQQHREGGLARTALIPTVATTVRDGI